MLQWRKKQEFNILYDISDDVTLVHLMDTSGNVNHNVSISVICIYDSNYKRAHTFIKEPLDINNVIFA